jgi:gas vesicle protein
MRFLLGLAIGYVVGLLVAPAPGEQTRSQIADKARDLSQIPVQKAAEAAEQAKQKAGDIGSRVGRQAAEAAVQAATDELRGKNKESA